MNSQIPRMRTLDAAFEYVKQCDPETSLTKYALRQAVVSGALPTVKAGKKYLINLQVLEDWMQGGSPAQEEECSGGIRRIDAKAHLQEVRLS